MKQCFWIWDHDWTKWKTIRKGQELTKSVLSSNFHVTANVYEQSRECKKCGILETRLERTEV